MLNNTIEITINRPFLSCPKPSLFQSKAKGARLRACLHGGGGPQIGEVTHLSCKRDQIIIGDYMDRRVTPPKRVTSPTWGPPPPCEQVLSEKLLICKQFFIPACK